VSAKADRYADHVELLAAQHGVAIVIRGRGIAYRRERKITIPEVRGQVSYLTALHELGHVVGPRPKLRLSQEVAAWRWALDVALDEPTPAAWRSILRALESYARRSARWQSMQRPADFDAFLDYVRAAAAG